MEWLARGKLPISNVVLFIFEALNLVPILNHDVDFNFWSTHFKSYILIYYLNFILCIQWSRFCIQLELALTFSSSKKKKFNYKKLVNI